MKSISNRIYSLPQNMTNHAFNSDKEEGKIGCRLLKKRLTNNFRWRSVIRADQKEEMEDCVAVVVKVQLFKCT